MPQFHPGCVAGRSGDDVLLAGTGTATMTGSPFLLHSNPYCNQADIDEIISRKNARRAKRIDAERPALQPPSRQRTCDHEETVVTVTSSGRCEKYLTFEYSLEKIPDKLACRLMVNLLARFAPDPVALPAIVVNFTPLIDYEALLGADMEMA